VLFPYTKSRLQTRRSVPIVAKRLALATSSNTILPALFARPDAIFVGTVEDDRFAVWPHIHGSNPFVPFIEGQILPGLEDCALVEFRLSPHPIVAALVVVSSIACLLAGHPVGAAVVLFLSVAGFVLSARHACRRLDSVLAPDRCN
jgi:hypothetical protein